ncbi:MAG: DNA cytosine methyltransferase [Kofleriaceae bacterium]
MTSTRKPVVVSLFSGAGGLDYGFEAAGFSTAVAIEMDYAACETLRANQKKHAIENVIERDIFDVPSDEILETANVKRGDVDVLIGGPPCQPFSKSGYWARGDARRLEDPRANTLSAYLRVLEETRPRAFLLENVEGLAFRGKDEGLKLLIEAFEGINKRTKSNYCLAFKLLNAADFGVPQQRKRLILVGARDGTEFTFPEATHGDVQLDLLCTLEPRRTAWDAIGGLKPDRGEDLRLTGKWADLLPSIPEGQNYLWHTDRGGGEPLFGWRRRYWSFLLKLAKKQPSWTIQAQPGPASGPFHWENRRLSTKELCRLQTFPEELIITGSRLDIQKQIGNAVPSLLAEVLAREIRTQILDFPKARGPLKLLPSVRTTVPPEEEVANVPRKFKPLRGKHEPHPGPGQGHGALQRLSLGC